MGVGAGLRLDLGVCADPRKFGEAGRWVSLLYGDLMGLLKLVRGVEAGLGLLDPWTGVLALG